MWRHHFDLLSQVAQSRAPIAFGKECLGKLLSDPIIRSSETSHSEDPSPLRSLEAAAHLAELETAVHRCCNWVGLKASLRPLIKGFFHVFSHDLKRLEDIYWSCSVVVQSSHSRSVRKLENDQPWLDVKYSEGQGPQSPEIWCFQQIPTRCTP